MAKTASKKWNFSAAKQVLVSGIKPGYSCLNFVKNMFKCISNFNLCIEILGFKKTDKMERTRQNSN